MAGSYLSFKSSHSLESLGLFTDITDLRRDLSVLETTTNKLSLLASITRHDILNKLITLRGYIQYANRSTTDPKLQNYLEEGERLAKEIQMLIIFARDYQEIGIRAPKWQILHQVVGNVSQVLHKPGIQITFLGDPCEVYADPLLERVFYNIVENALRHGERTSCVAITWSRNENGLLIRCEDNGCGIPEDERDKIFARGYGKHTGLGLYFSREILKITGITIRERGVPGKGAAFEILVPAGGYRYPV